MTKHNSANDRFDESQPNYAEACLKQGRLYHHQQKYSQALEEFDKAIEIDSNYAESIHQPRN